MVRLVATDPFAGRLPLSGPGIAVSAADPGPMTLVMVRRGSAPRVAGLPFPDPGRVSAAERGGKRLIWMAPGQALLTGAPPPAGRDLALVDQSDGWAVARVAGPAGPEVLARLVPLDLRPAAFAPGTTARTLIGHMTGSVTRIDGDTLELMVMRSMAGTLVHDLGRAIGTSRRD